MSIVHILYIYNVDFCMILNLFRLNRYNCVHFKHPSCTMNTTINSQTVNILWTWHRNCNHQNNVIFVLQFVCQWLRSGSWSKMYTWSSFRAISVANLSYSYNYGLLVWFCFGFWYKIICLRWCLLIFAWPNRTNTLNSALG